MARPSPPPSSATPHPHCPSPLPSSCPGSLTWQEAEMAQRQLVLELESGSLSISALGRDLVRRRTPHGKEVHGPALVGGRDYSKRGSLPGLS